MNKHKEQCGTIIIKSLPKLEYISFIFEMTLMKYLT